MHCIHCRKLNRNGSRICRHCGKSLLRKHNKISNMFRKSDAAKKQRS